MRIGSLCSGIGGLELGLEWAGAGRTVWHAELDPHASRVLAHHWPGVPNHGDLRAVEWAHVEPVDLVCAGYPCQPFSYAGMRKGEADDRHLWPEVLRSVRVLRPRLVVLENVAGHLSMGFGRVLGDLAEAGYDCRWACVRSSDVGAPHRRERVFIVAADPGSERREGGGEPDREPVEPGLAASRRAHAARHDPPPADPDRTAGRPARGAGEAVHEPGPVERPGRRDRVAWGPFDAAIRQWEHLLGRHAPHPQDQRGRLNPVFVEWMLGYPPEWATSHLTRAHALRCLGNSVQPQVSEHVAHAARLTVGNENAPRAAETAGGLESYPEDRHA